MPTTDSNVTYFDHMANYGETLNLAGGSSASIERRIAWSQRNTFFSDMLGWSRRTPAGNLDRKLPARHPTLPWLVAQQVDLVGYTGAFTQETNNDEKPQFGEGVYRVTFGPVQYNLLENSETFAFGDEKKRFVRYQSRPATEALQIPGTAFMWLEDGVVIMEPAVKLFPTTAASYTWINIPVVPRTAIQACLGKVNQYDWTDGEGNVYRAETLLFENVEIDDSKNERGRGSALGIPNTDNNYDVTYHLLERNNGITGLGNYAGWNHLYRLTSARFEQIVDVATGQLPYGRVDFNRLFSLA